MTAQKIREAIKEAIKSVAPEVGDIAFDVSPPEVPRFGDYSSNAALVLAKKLGKQPIEIAHELRKAMTGKLMGMGLVDVAPPGFLNVRLSTFYVQSEVARILKEQEKYGKSDWGKDIKPIVEFISANPTGPLTIGNSRGGFFGDTLANILAFYGSRVMREYYVNDTGNQIEILGKSILAERGEYEPQKDEQLYRGEYIKELAKGAKGKDAAEIGSQAAFFILEKMIKPSLKKLGIEFDQFFSEESLVKTHQITQILNTLYKHGLAYEADGAVWLKSKEFGFEKDKVLKRRTGNHTYLTSDLAYHLYKMRRGYNAILTIVGPDHIGELPIVEKFVSEVFTPWLGWSGRMDVLIHQTVRVKSQGKEIKMSKRLGTYVTPDEVVEEVGLDAFRFYMLLQSLESHIDLDLDLLKKQSEENPVYRVQYAHARVSSILKKAGNPRIETASTKKLTHPAEMKIAKLLIRFPEIVADIAATHHVQKLAHYTLELSSAFHPFYEDVRVITEDKKVTAARLGLVKATQTVLRNALTLLGVSAPEEMAKRA
jgi:arginyl-tRNA synthetase